MIRRCWLLKDELVAQNENNPLYYTITHLQLLFPYGDNYTKKQYGDFRKLLSSLRTILVNPTVTDVFAYFLMYGAATALLLEMRLDTPNQSIYRALRKLVKLNIIEKKQSINVRWLSNSSGGPKPTVYGILTASDVQIRKCRRDHLKMNSPKFRFAERFAFNFIDDYLEPRGMKRVDQFIVKKALTEESFPYSFGDVYQFAITCLKDQGYEVWQ